MIRLFTYVYTANFKRTFHFLSLTFFLFITTSIAQAQDVLVGLTSNGGPEGKGTAFSIKTNGTSFSIVKGFPDWGKNPNGDLVQGADGSFYGMTSRGGAFNEYGTIFKISAAGVVTVLRQL